MNRHEFGAIGERPFDLNLPDQLEDLGRDERNRLGVIELEAARPALASELAGRKNQELVDFSRRQMHGGFLRGRIIPAFARNVTHRASARQAPPSLATSPTSF